jgi:cytoskeleton protein RodZ
MIENEEQAAELPLEGVGAQLARARQAAGKSLADIARVTKISERQLAAIEAGNYAALPSRTYAVGFTRTYAKALGLDSAAVIERVREELAQLEPDHARRTVPAFEPGDPARLPGGRVAWYAAAGLAVVLLAGFLIWPNLYAPGGSLPSILPSATPSATAPVAAPAPAPVNGPVVFTATRDKVWVRFADGTGQQLLQKELALGESWTVPETAGAVTLTTARPDGLSVTIGGRAVPPLANAEQLMRDVPVTAAALLARGTQPAAAPLASPAPATASAAATPRRQSRPAAEQPSAAPPAAATAEPVSTPPTAPATATTTGTADSQG